jgi:hypothetical protein
MATLRLPVLCARHMQGALSKHGVVQGRPILLKRMAARSGRAAREAAGASVIRRLPTTCCGAPRYANAAARGIARRVLLRRSPHWLFHARSTMFRLPNHRGRSLVAVMTALPYCLPESRARRSRHRARSSSATKPRTHAHAPTMRRRWWWASWRSASRSAWRRPACCSPTRRCRCVPAAHAACSAQWPAAARLREPHVWVRYAESR